MAKSIKRILIIAAIVVIFLILSVYILLWIPPVQQKIVDIALRELSEKTGNRMSIGSIWLRPFSALELRDVYAADLRGDTLLHAERLSSKFHLLPLLRGRLVIRSVELDSFKICLTKAGIEGPINFQFFIDAFASTDTAKRSGGGLKFEIDDILLSHGYFSYDILSEPVRDSVFDARHMRVENLNAHVTLSSLDMKRLDATVKHLSFKERSGLTLTDFSLVLASEDEVMTLENLELRLPRSLLKIPRAKIDYSGAELRKLADSSEYELSLDVPYFRLADIKAFVPSLAVFSDSISLQSEISGRFPEAKVDRLELAYGNDLDLIIEASLADYKRWYDAPFTLRIPSLELRQRAVAVAAALTKNGKLPVHTNGIKLTANFSGSLPDMRMHISAVSSPSGKLALDGKGGYVFRTGETHFDMKLSTTDFDLKSLLNGNPELGSVSMALETAGNIDRSGRIDARADLRVAAFDFHRYTYRDIEALATYKDKNIVLRLSSADPNAPLYVSAKVNLSPTPTASLYLKTTGLRPDKLHLLTDAKAGDLFAVLKAEVRGFDIEKMTANLTLDSVRFTSPKGTAELKPVHLAYEASSNSEKKIGLRSKLMTVDVSGRFSPKTVASSFQHTMSVYFPRFVAPPKPEKIGKDSLRVDIKISDTEKWSDLLAAPIAIIDTARFTVAYCVKNNTVNIKADFPKLKIEDAILRGTVLSLRGDTVDRKMHLDAGTIRFGTSDTVHADLSAKTLTDSLGLRLKFRVITPKVNSVGELGLAARFEKVEGQKLPDIFVHLFPSMIRFNRRDLHVKSAHLSMRGNEYEADNFEIRLSDTEFLRIGGRVSRNDRDTLRVGFGGLQIETLMHAFGPDINLKGEINGEITANQLLTSPRIFTEGFQIKDISLENQAIGTLTLQSGWSGQLKAMTVKAELSRPGARTSFISGSIYPQRDSMMLHADVHDVLPAWIIPYTKGALYGLDGSIGVRLKAEGKIKFPSLSGVILFKDVNVGISKTNVKYGISDSVQIFPDRWVMKDFAITDGNKQRMLINGEVKHSDFSDICPTLAMEFRDFLLLNNPGQTDSLFYGTFRAGGTVRTEGSIKDLTVRVAIKNGSDSRVFIALPENQIGEARQYKSVTFVSNDSVLSVYGSSPATATAAPSTAMPFRLIVNAEVTPDLRLGVIYNPKTKDAATVSGGGKINFTYNAANADMNLLGEYKIEKGECTVSLKNITKRTFTIQRGGTLTFKGDPKATEFDVTAIYKLRADLLSLDATAFGNQSKTRVNTECHIQVSGSMEKMKIGYAVLFPDEDESIQRKADALMPTDEIKLKEIAYLLVAGTFYPPANTDVTKPSGNNVWTTLASSALTTQLNHLLDGVLSDNWTIGTELHSKDGEASNIEMDVSISTSLFNDRLVLSGNIGYRNDDGSSSGTSTNSNTNFTGDFDMQYKLNKAGNVVLKMYNVTNDQYYEQAPTTQGIGLMYRREAKKFSDLFKRLKRVK